MKEVKGKQEDRSPLLLALNELNVRVAISAIAKKKIIG